MPYPQPFPSSSGQDSHCPLWGSTLHWRVGMEGGQRTDLLPELPEPIKQRQQGGWSRRELEISARIRESPARFPGRGKSLGTLFLLCSLFFSKTQNFKAGRDLSSLPYLKVSISTSLSLFYSLSLLSPLPPSPASALLISALAPISPPLSCSAPFSQSMFFL